MENIRRFYRICALKLPENAPTSAYNFYGIKAVIMNPKKYKLRRYDDARQLVAKVVLGGNARPQRVLVI